MKIIGKWKLVRSETRWKVLGKRWKGCLSVSVVPIPGGSSDDHQDQGEKKGEVMVKGTFAHGVRDDEGSGEWDFEGYRAAVEEKKDVTSVSLRECCGNELVTLREPPPTFLYGHVGGVLHGRGMPFTPM